MKKILITSGRSPITLALARLFHQAGHRVVVAETMRLPVTRFSNAIDKYFRVPSPRNAPKEFVASLVRIVKQEKVDLVIPIYEEMIFLCRERDQFPKNCQIFAPSFELFQKLHHKWEFNQKLKELNFLTPKTFLIQKEEEIKYLDRSLSYALKPCYSRASLHLKKIKPYQSFPKIDLQKGKQWVAQEWIEGNQFCSYSISLKGQLKAHTTYPVQYTADEKGCINFKAIKHVPIFNWVADFVRLVGFTGQIAFDFIEDKKGRLFAIECNPRSTHGVFLFQQKDRLDQAFLNESKSLICPKEGVHIQMLLGMLLYGWRKSSCPGNNFYQFFKDVFQIKDIVFDLSDPLPFLSQPLTLLEFLLQSAKSKLSLPAAFMHDYEWNGGDI